MSTASHARLDRTGLRGRLILMLAALVIASVTALGVASIAAFDRAIEPEISNRARLIGTIIRSEVQRALELGIPIDAMAGLDRYLETTLTDFAEVERIEVTTARGATVAAAERAAPPALMSGTRLGEMAAVRRSAFELPILLGNRLVGGIRVEISPVFVQTRLRDVFLDVMVLALVATFIAVELALAVTISSVGKPLDRVLRLLGQQRGGDFRYLIRPGGLGGLGRTAARLNDHARDLAARVAVLPEAAQAQIGPALSARLPLGAPLRLRLSDFNDIRLALFLFCLGTEVAAAFIPVFARDAERPGWLTPEFAAAAPSIFYVLAIALVVPFGSTLIRRLGARALFLLSAPGAALALGALALSESVVAITLWHGLMALFYATAAVAGQEYAIRAAGERDRAKAVAAFVAVAYGGLFAGSALGGLIAGRFGYEAAFAVGGVLAAASIALGLTSMRGRAGDRGGVASDDDAAPPAAPIRWLTPAYLALVLGVAVPMNATMEMFVWYLAPLMLNDQGSGPADIARVLMLFTLMILLLGPTVARLADGRIGPRPLILLGGLTSGLALLSMELWQGFWAIVAAVVGVGLGQVMMQTPIYALALRLTGGPGRGIDALRLIERLGAIVGLIIAAVLLSRIGAADSLRLLGFAVLAGVVAFAIVGAGGKSTAAQTEK